MLTIIEKPGTGIFLMKESSKLYRPHRKEKRISSRKDWVAPPRVAVIAEGIKVLRIRDKTLGEDSSLK